ncbi:PQQ-like beta-propeller repeat protein [bacterium]|nr:PQQ-like beta-propeller repeat protein [bacterium]
MEKRSIKLHLIFFVATAIFLCCCFTGCSQKIENLESVDTAVKSSQIEEVAKTYLNDQGDWKYDDNTKSTLQVSEEGKKIDPKRQLVEWRAKDFDGRGKLEKKWEIEIDKNQEYPIRYVFSYPDSWSIGDWYVVDPITGKNPKRDYHFEKSELYDLMLSGPTDGKYVFGCKNHVGVSSYCWRIKDGINIWVGSLMAFDSSQFFIIKNNLIHIDMSPPNKITKVAPWSGEKIWAITSKNNISPSFNKGYKEVTCGIAAISNNLFTLLDNGHLYKIDSDSGKWTLVNGVVQKPIAISTIGKSLLILLSDGSLAEIDGQSLKVKAIFKTGIDLGISADGAPIDYWVQSIGSKILIANEERSPIKASYIFDSKNKTCTSLGCNDVFTLNSSLIIEDQTQLRGVDPETLETLWWIDKKDLGENAHVAWLDWRGVCVISDTKIMCFGPK